MTDKDQDQDWLGALAGKPNPGADPEVTRRATLLRQAIQRHDARLQADEFDVEAGLQKLMLRIGKDSLVENKSDFNTLIKRWAAIIVSLLSAFAFGVTVTRFAMLPVMEGVRSDVEIVEMRNLNGFAQKVPVYVSDPTITTKLVVSDAIRLKLNFTINATSDGYNLLVEGLVSNAPDQNQLKDLLGISKSASGNLLFQIRRKAHD